MGDSDALGPNSKVLDDMCKDGTFDAFRARIVDELKKNEDLNKYTSNLVEGSETLSRPGAERMTRKDLFEKLKAELEKPVMEKVSAAAWEFLLAEEGVGKEIKDKVEAACGQQTR
ncbi:hypothetical protein CYMTET_17934 [Cymbomonas tetramitiformis]|uniref:Uncharacterized protein n=1 Tax=Cymbomonas tetramitiformis TaxID=36881 RepID=A0AAE0L6S4_9CHLO|nr:hypothetical protein CYMTET_17934 [Cymbomonas tetramitiformis]|eukprot:gene4417-5427_t